MITILFEDYWEGIVTYYYEHVQDNRNISIWEWLERDFGAVRTGYNSVNGSIVPTKLRFGKREDLTAFKLIIELNT